MKGKNLLSVSVLTSLLVLNISSVFAQTAEEYLSNGNDSFKRGHFDQAISEYTQAIDIDPNLEKAFNNRGVAYAQEGSLQRAIDDFTLAIAINLKDAEAYNNRGHAYDKMGNLTQAIADYTSAIANNAFYVKAYNNRALAFYKLGKYDKAWADVFVIEGLGSPVDPDLYNDLKKASSQPQ